MKRTVSCSILVLCSTVILSALPPKNEVNPDAKIYKFSTTIEKERPELDEVTKSLISAYRRNPSKENYDALKNLCRINYEAVIARKEAKLEELKKTARYESQVQEMQEIVDEMHENEEKRIEQMMARFTDERARIGNRDADKDFHAVLGAESNVYIAHTPVTNAQYALFTGKAVKAGEENLPVVNVSVMDIEKYCAWLKKQDGHTYRLPTEEEWELAAGHMPKDADFNVEESRALTPVDKYPQTPGACGGVDFWGNVWEWTSTEKSKGENYVKGGAFDSKRMDCRTEAMEESRKVSGRYANVGFRLVRIEN